MMTDMKTKSAERTQSAASDTFTVRDLNRQPQAVLTAARTHGRAIIRSRTGERFVVSPEQPVRPRVLEARAFVERLEALHKKLKESGFVPPNKEESDLIARMIAGEDV